MAEETTKAFKTFEEFWPYYLDQHKNPTCRELHYFGTTLAILCVAAGLFVAPHYLLFAPFAGYGFAWIGHFFFEKNMPATFQYPAWSLRGDLKMYFEFVSGKRDRQ